MEVHATDELVAEAISETMEDAAAVAKAVEEAVVVAETAAALPPPNVNSCVEAPEQAAESKTLFEVTVKQVPTALIGANSNGPDPPDVKLNN